MSAKGFAERYTPVNYLLFVTFFPHLIAGPIVHHRDLMPQFEESRNYRFQPTEVAIGLSIFCIGLAKKTLIADAVGKFSETLLSGGHVGWATAWAGILAYSMQLYFDFSGYSDMAIGLARLFGIKFPINFDSPYKATSIIEFWQRWHITLTRFLTAYTYNPLALTPGAQARQCKPVDFEAGNEDAFRFSRVDCAAYFVDYAARGNLAWGWVDLYYLRGAAWHLYLDQSCLADFRTKI